MHALGQRGGGRPVDVGRAACAAGAPRRARPVRPGSRPRAPRARWPARPARRRRAARGRRRRAPAATASTSGASSGASPRWSNSAGAAEFAPPATVPPPSNSLGVSARTTYASPGKVVVARRRCSVASTGAVSAGTVSNTSVPTISAAPRYARTGVRRRSRARASGSARKRTRSELPGANAGSASTAPRCVCATSIPGKLTATREPPSTCWRRSRNTCRPRTRTSRAGVVEPQRVADAQRALHQRAGDDRAVPRHGEGAVDR